MPARCENANVRGVGSTSARSDHTVPLDKKGTRMAASQPTTDAAAPQVEYRPVVGFPGYYVGNDGTVWSAKLKGGSDRSPNRRGYISVNMTRDGRNYSRFIYATDDHDVDHLVARVHNYCRERGADPQMRIALAGYDGEHNELEELGWQPLAWKANGGYGNRNAGANENAVRERIWFSPHCLAELPTDSDVRQVSLFT